MTNERLRDLLGEEVMTTTRGYPSDRTKHAIEWVEDNPDSQFSMVLEDVDTVLNKLRDLGYLQDIPNQESALLGVVSPVSRTTRTVGGLRKNVLLSIELPAGSSLEELEEYVETLKALDVSPDEIVTASGMKYVVNLTDCGFERIACGECGYKDYLVFPHDHVCILD